MNLYECEGKELFEKFGIPIPSGKVIWRGEHIEKSAKDIMAPIVLKAQVLSGKRGKAGGIKMLETSENLQEEISALFDLEIHGQHVAAVYAEEKLDIAREHYLSITYDTNSKQPVLIYSASGGMDIEDVPASDMQTIPLDIRTGELPESCRELPEGVRDIAEKLWHLFLDGDARIVEINPLAELGNSSFIAADAKIAIDDDAFFRHKGWEEYPARTMMGRAPTKRELAVKNIDEGEGYYRGTAGKYIEMDGDIAVLFSGGGASISAMDAMMKEGLRPANYTEYSGNPPREKVSALAKIVLSKSGLRGLWIAGGVANFTDIAATFQGIIDAIDVVKPSYPIVIRRAGPNEEEGMELMRACAERNNLMLTIFGKEVPMSETAKTLAGLVN